MSDLSRPNHPDPDPMFEGLSSEQVAAAKSAKCARCKVPLVESKGLTGTVFVSYYVPLLGVKQREFLCGPCGLAFREFLYPELADNAAFQMAKTELLARFS